MLKCHPLCIKNTTDQFNELSSFTLLLFSGWQCLAQGPHREAIKNAHWTEFSKVVQEFPDSSNICFIFHLESKAPTFQADNARHGVKLLGLNKPIPSPCSNQPCNKSSDKGREKHTSHLSQVIFNLLFSPENSTNSKLQVPPCITTPQMGFFITRAATLVLWGTHSAPCSFKRKKKEQSKLHHNYNQKPPCNHPPNDYSNQLPVTNYLDYFRHRTWYIVYP